MIKPYIKLNNGSLMDGSMYSLKLHCNPDGQFIAYYACGDYILDNKIIKDYSLTNVIDKLNER